MNKLMSQISGEQGFIKKAAFNIYELSGNSFLFAMFSGFEAAANGPSLYVKEDVEEEDVDEYMDKLLKTFKVNTTKF